MIRRRIPKGEPPPRLADQLEGLALVVDWLGILAGELGASGLAWFTRPLAGLLRLAAKMMR